MATVAPSDISVELAAAAAQPWSQEGLTEEEELKISEYLNKSFGNGERVKEALKSLSTRRLRIQENIHPLGLKVFKFIGGHEAEYPGLTPFKEDWHGYADDWRRISDASEKIAEINAYEYEHFATMLKEISAPDMHVVMRQMRAGQLKKFAERERFVSPVDLKEETLSLQQKLDHFREDCKKCISGHSEEENNLVQTIDALKDEIQKLDKDIILAAASLGLSTTALLLGVIAAGIAGTILGRLAIKRKAKQKELDDLIDQLNAGKFNLSQFAEIEAQIASLDLLSLAEGFTIFQNISGLWRQDALHFAERFKAPGPLPEMIKNQVELAISASASYVEGLKQYAASIE